MTFPDLFSELLPEATQEDPSVTLTQCIEILSADSIDQDAALCLMRLAYAMVGVEAPRPEPNSPAEGLCDASISL